MTVAAFIAKWKRSNLKERSAANKGVAVMGETRGGPFDIPEALAREWLALRAHPFPFGSKGLLPVPEEATGTVALRQAIADAASRLDTARRNWLGDRTDRTRTLTALYNRKPTWLVDAHRDLDDAVFAAYGWRAAPERPGEGGPANMTDDQILERLLTLNLERGGRKDESA